MTDSMNQTQKDYQLGRAKELPVCFNRDGWTLDQWNCEQQSAWDDRRRKQAHPEEFPNGLICPKDGGKLYDTGQSFLPEWARPGKMRVKCMNHDCDFRGERLERVKRIQD